MTSKLSMKLLKKEIPKLCAISLIFSSCATKTIGESFEGGWIFLEDQKGTAHACLPESDVVNLRTILRRYKEACDQ